MDVQLRNGQDVGEVVGGLERRLPAEDVGVVFEGVERSVVFHSKFCLLL